MTETQSVPAHLRESIFRQYEALIKKGVDAFPSETSFTIPTNVAPTTFVARFRDSILSLKLYKWETVVDCDRLWKIAGQYAVSHDREGVVWFRLKHRHGRPNLMMSEARTHTDEPSTPISRTGIWENVTPEEVTAVCRLIHGERLVGPIIIVGRIDPDLSNALQEDFNVAIVYDDKTNNSIIT